MKTIGILGGMGALATVDFLNKLVHLTPAHQDQGYPELIIYMNPRIPDRTRAIMKKGKSPLPALRKSLKFLEDSGADFIVIPCVTAHFWIDELKNAVGIPVISIIDIIIFHIRKMRKIKRIGILATTGTLKSRIIQQPLVSLGYQIILPDPGIQKDYVMRAIYGVKSGRSVNLIKPLIEGSYHHLVEKGAQLIIAGCTEIPIVTPEIKTKIPILDINELLALETIKYARGRRKIK